MYSPLSLEGIAIAGDSLPREPSVSSWIREIFRAFRPASKSRERQHLESQLKSRISFDESSWRKTETEIEKVRIVLDLLHRELDWPNSHFQPNDPLRLCLCESLDNLESIEFFFASKEVFQSALKLEDFSRLIEANATLEDFIDLLLKSSPGNVERLS